MNNDTLPVFDKLWDYSDPRKTEAAFRDLLPAAEAAGDDDYLAQLLTQIARAQGLQGNFAGANQTLDRVEEIVTPDLKVARTRMLLERGRVLNSSGRAGEALPFFHRAYEAGREAAAPRYTIDALHMIAIAVSDPGEQVEWNLKGIALADAEPGQKGWLHALLNNIGESYLKLGQYDRARGSFQRLSELQTSAWGEPDMYTVKDIAKAERLLGHPERSRELMQPIQEKLLVEGKDDGYIRLELAEALLAAGDKDTAAPHFAVAYEFLSKDEWFTTSEPQELERLKAMAGGGS